MYQVFAVITLLAGLLGLLYALLSRGVAWSVLRSFRETLPALAPGAAALLVLILLTLPESRPFAPGMRLGWGMLLGGVPALAAVLLGFAETGTHWPGRLAGLLALALPGPAFVLLLFRDDPVDALFGCTLAAMLIAAPVSGLLRAKAHAGAAMPDAAYRSGEIHALVVTAMATGILLAVAHFPSVTAQATGAGYRGIPLLLAAAGMLAVALAGGLRRQPLLVGGAAALLAVLVILVLQLRFLPDLIWWLPALGAAAMLMALIVLPSGEGSSVSRSLGPLAGAIVLALAVMALAFRQQQGFGQALAVLAALPVAATAWCGGKRAALSPTLAIGIAAMMLVLALTRVLYEQAGRSMTLDFQQQYNLFALLAGMVIVFAAPAMLARYHDADGGEPYRYPVVLIRTGLLGMLLAIAPIGITAVWGMQACTAYLTGLVAGLAAWLLLTAWATGADRERALAAFSPLFAIASALLAVKFTPAVLALTLSRTQKVQAVIALGVLVLVGIGVDFVVGRIRRREKVETKVAVGVGR